MKMFNRLKLSALHTSVNVEMIEEQKAKYGIIKLLIQ